MNDEALAAGVREGNPAAEQALRDVVDRLRGLTRIKLWDGFKDHADDIVADTYAGTLAALRRGRYQPGKAKLTTYIHRIWLNKCADFFESIDRQRRIAGSGEGMEIERSQAAARVADRLLGAAIYAAAGDECQRIFDAIMGRARTAVMKELGLSKDEYYVRYKLCVEAARRVRDDKG